VGSATAQAVEEAQAEPGASWRLACDGPREDGLMANRRRREYLRLLDAAKAASEVAVDSFNQTRNPYRNETTLMLLCNAWELLSKAVLSKHHKRITEKGGDRTITAEKAVHRLHLMGVLDLRQKGTIQQIISLRNEATHYVLPPLPDELMHHLLFYSAKFFRETVAAQFPTHAKDIPTNTLSLSFGEMTTYADRVQKAVSRARRSPDDSRLVWLLERGLAFDGESYLTEKQVAAKYKDKHRIMPHLELDGFLRSTDMVRIVPVEAPKNYTADIKLRKGKATDATLPVVVTRTDIEADYPYLTTEVATQIGKSVSWTARAAQELGLKGDDRFHQRIRTSRSSHSHRYSEAAVQRLKHVLAETPTFNPFG
jgi:hypothetical protein